jgi:uncharacterized protein (DUF1800 family)
MTHWKLYTPGDTASWNLTRVVHLHRRTVFGATAAEQRRDLTDDPQNVVSRILNGTVRINTPPSFHELSDVIGNAAADSSNPDRLKAWWLYRCLFSPNPLQERLTLIWHNHFATSNLKINNLQQMKQQNETLRKHSRSPFGVLLNAMLRDPALLVWLDAPVNRKGQPNENLARELMELFTLGVGHYTETDVKETARALTGWTIRNGGFEQRPNLHDDGEKTILNETGDWTGSDVADILLKQPATAKRLAWRLTSECFGENVVSKDAIDELAAQLQSTELDIAAAVETILRSSLFFSDANINSRICDPVSFMIGPLRTLDCADPPPSTLMLAEWLRRMGQNLFYPPNVGGWNGGRTWLSTRTVIARTNYAAALVSGQLHNPVRVPELSTLEGRGNDIGQVAKLVGVQCDSDAARRISNEHQKLDGQEKMAATIVSLLMLPEAHLH